MFSRISSIFIICITTSSFFFPLVALAVPITLPTSLNPGDQYRLAFLTPGTIDATSSDISTYNTFVTNEANAQVELAALGTTWKAIGSTASVDARDNTETNPFNASHISVPIFLLNETKLVDSNDDLWDGTIDTFFNVFSDGTVVGGIVPTVWTGTSPDGTIGSLGLGSSSVVGGYPVITTSRWISTGFFSSHLGLPMYAVSDVLTVSGAPIPEPSTLLLFAVALVSVIGIGYRRKRTK
ncbi:PEP-CTERM sorting domain-containing protein [bacterium]|nr:PEP-CTERM sorting domain-containing protein [bacterium]